MENKNKLSKIFNEASVSDLFELRTKTNPQAIAVIDIEGRKYNYKNFLKRILRLASLLVLNNIKPKDRIAIVSENRSEYLELQMACAKIGAIVAAINWRLTVEESQYCVDLVAPKIIFFSERYEDKCISLNTKKIKLIKLSEEFQTQLNLQEEYIGENIGRGEDPLVILYTSGTTGNPKGAVISHRAFIARAFYNVLEYGIEKEDTFPAWAPMFHMASTDLAIGSLLIGGSVAFFDGFKHKAIIETIKKNNISWLVLMPGMLEEFIENLKINPVNPKNIKIMGAMADLIPKAQIAQITRLLSTPYLNSFGSTETGMPPASAGKIPTNTKEYSLSKIQSSFCEIKLVDERGAEVKTGNLGECLVKGPTLFSGYWNEENINANELKAGWFKMGDVMKENRDGSLDFVDRKKYLIKSGGENIYPAEIERVLFSHESVIEAVAVKIGSKKWGETPVVLVSTIDEKEFNRIYKDLLSRCRKKLAGYKQPSSILFMKKEKIPRSTTGKVQRHVLEEMVKNKLEENV